MAIEGLKWVMELMDRTSGPARRVVSSLQSVASAQERMQRASASTRRGPAASLDIVQRGAVRNASLSKQLESVTAAQSGASSSGSSLSGVLSGMGGALATVGTAAMAAASAIAGIGMAGARSAVELGGFQESTMVSMRTMLGSSSAAEGEFDRAVQIARATPFDTRAVVTMRRQLLGAGVRDSRERDMLSGIITDLSALNPEDSSVMQRVTTAISQIRGSGRLRSEELGQLTEAGLSRESLYTELAPLLNVQGSGEAANRQVQQMIERGRVNAQVAQVALGRAVMRMTNTTAVGQFSSNQGATIPGLLSTLGSAVPELLMGRSEGDRTTKGTRLFEGAGFQAFKGFLQQVIDLLRGSSETGRRLQRVMRGLIDDVFGLFRLGSDQNNKGGLTGVFNAALTVIETVISGVKTLVKWVAAIGGGYFEVMGPLFEAIGSAAQQFFSMFSGGESEAVMQGLRGIGILLGLIIAPLAIISAAAVALVVALAAAIGWLLTQIGQAFSWLMDHFDEIKAKLMRVWEAVPAPLREFVERLTGGGTMAVDVRSPLSDANRVVDVRPGEGRINPVVSQPNVTVNVQATTDRATDAQGIASAVSSTIPPVVHSAAERATRGAQA
ncbi:MAG: hypothetical protein U0269_13715 [Polyangiales bacterium]